MMENKKVKQNKQSGIERVKQKKGDMCYGQGGKMGKVERKEGFKRSNSAKTPRPA